MDHEEDIILWPVGKVEESPVWMNLWDLRHYRKMKPVKHGWEVEEIPVKGIKMFNKIKKENFTNKSHLEIK